ncbi:MAG: hypothetical protein JXR58_08525 [Bacteroidales bacterium]|nr:hypothetical protein [Bacteroidales bacterium]
MENYFRNKSVASLAMKWKYHLIVIAVVAAALSFAASYLITPKFKSFAVFYPTNIMPLSDESETEQILEIIKSQDIRNDIFAAFDLFKHYGIDSASEKAYSTINNIFENNVTFSKTENEAIMITVYDKDPQIASDMVDSIIVFCNRKILNMQKEKSREYLTVTHDLLTRKWSQMDSLVKRQNEIRKEYGILDYRIQVEQYTKAMLEGRNSGDSKQMLDYIKDYGEEFRVNDSLLWMYSKKFGELQSNYDNNVRDVEKYITYTHIITYPYPADVKSSPKRSIITIFGVLGALLMSLIIIALIESKKEKK